MITVINNAGMIWVIPPSTSPANGTLLVKVIHRLAGQEELQPCQIGIFLGDASMADGVTSPPVWKTLHPQKDHGADVRPRFW